ncbi:E3 ubiquitin-protein ligase TRIM36-like [Saccostrea cucullata]|uniref:E3 ubiquitin-protein ligase TRIM36-like n=1 Tax=Saccostrea cuccullata TaxID=36930 RepID=UPI002ECFBC64
MDPRYSAQNVLLCDLCELYALQSHCQTCKINLCMKCVEIHLSSSSLDHEVVPYVGRNLHFHYRKCQGHPDNQCEYRCQECDIPVCFVCISNSNHQGHKIVEILENSSIKILDLEKEFEELEKQIYPKYEEIASDIKLDRAHLETHYAKLTLAVDKQGENLQREITTIVNKRKCDIDDMKSKHIATLIKQEDETMRISSELRQIISDLKKVIESNDGSLASVYKSRNAEFRRFPPKVEISAPIFSPRQIHKEQVTRILGPLSDLSITIDENGYTLKTQESDSSLPHKPLLDEPKLLKTINTEHALLFRVTCFSDEEIWTGGSHGMKLYTPNGKILKTITTKSGFWPFDIAVTKNGELVYTDPDLRTVNVVKKKHIQELIQLKGWVPRHVCSTLAGDLLVTMFHEKNKQSKVVRYSGPAKKQTIQFDEKGKLLYSSEGTSYKYIAENKNLDICVADNGADAVVVVNQAGKLRFRYTRSSFKPRGITTDSQSRILVSSDERHGRVLIIDQDGHFLHIIKNIDLMYAMCLSVDTQDILYVPEHDSAKIRKIKYT